MPSLPVSKELAQTIKTFFKEKFSTISAESMGWIAILLLHGATIPSLLALMAGITDNVPPVDVIILLWAGLITFFIKAAIQRDLLNMITIGAGFMVQAFLMVLIFFK